MKGTLIALAIALLMIPVQAHAGTTGAVNGLVKDSGTGAPIAGINVLLWDVCHKTVQKTRTNNAGHFSFASVGVGRWSLWTVDERTDKAAGYATLHTSPFTVLADQSNSVVLRPHRWTGNVDNSGLYAVPESPTSGTSGYVAVSSKMCTS